MTAANNSRAFYSAYKRKLARYIMIWHIKQGGKEHEKRTHDGNRMERSNETALQESNQRHDHGRSGSSRKVYRFLPDFWRLAGLDAPGLAF